MTQETKKCSKCGEEKQLDQFRWLPHQHRYMAACHQCELASAREYNKRHRARVTPADKVKNKVYRLIQLHGAGTIAKYLQQYMEENS